MKLSNAKLSSLFLALSLSTNAIASDDVANYKLAVIKETVGSSEIINGKSATGIAALQSAPSTDSAFNISMGLCVGQLKALKFVEAEKSCTKAVNNSEINATRGRHGKLLKAFALSNRAVVRIFKDNNVGAFDDFTSALLLTNNKIISDNLTHFKTTIAKSTAEEQTTAFAE